MATHDHYATETKEEALKCFNQSNIKKRTGRVQYGGWAIVTPEDSLMLFLKHESNGRNHRYIGLDDLGLLKRKANMTMKMSMLQYDYGNDLRDVETIPHIMASLAQDIFVFEDDTGVVN